MESKDFSWCDRFLADFEGAQATFREVSAVPVVTARRWDSSLCGSAYTLQVDASFDDVSFSYSVGAAILGFEGQVLGASCQKIRPPGSVLGAELMAVNICSDSTDAVLAITKHGTYYGPEGGVLNNISHGSG